MTAVRPVAAEPYADHVEHLRDEFTLLDARLRALAKRRGDELDELLAPEVAPAALEARIAARAEASRLHGVELPLARVARSFGLSAWDLQIVTLCLAPELDARYERIFGTLQGDLARERPGPGLALELAGEDLALRAAGRLSLMPDAVLTRAGLLETDADGELRLPPRIVRLLLGDASPPDVPWLRFDEPRWAPSEAATQVAEQARRALGGEDPHIVFVLHGASARERRAFAEEVCASLAAALLTVDLPMLESQPEGAVRSAVREALLVPAAILVESGDEPAAVAADTRLRLLRLSAALDDFAWLAFVSAIHPLRSAGRPWIDVEVPQPDLARRARLWDEALEREGARVSADEADGLAARYPIPAPDMASAAAVAGAAARVRGKRDGPALADVEAACRDAVGPALTGLARRIAPRYVWDDMVLGAEPVRQLRELAAAVRSRRRVLADWEFGHKLSRGTGITALFSGPPGTGKTMAAEIIAGDARARPLSRRPLDAS